MKKIVGIFYGPHFAHKFFYDVLSGKFLNKKIISFKSVFNKYSNNKILLLLKTLFNINLIKNITFSNTVFLIEGPIHLIIWKNLFFKNKFIGIIADPLVYRLWIGGFFMPFFQKIYIYFLMKFDFLFANSYMVKDFLISLGISDKNIIYMPPFLESIRKDYIDKNNLFINKDNIKNKKLITIANGNDTRYKGIDFLDKLAIALKEIGWEIEVIGFWNSKIIEKFNNLNFLGVMDYENMYNYLHKNCSLGIIAGEGETFSCAALEMGYMKIPVIVREYVGFREVLEKTNFTSLILKNNNNIVNIINDFEAGNLDYQKIGDSIKNQVNSFYTEINTRERIKLFGKLLK